MENSTNAHEVSESSANTNTATGLPDPALFEDTRETNWLAMILALAAFGGLAWVHSLFSARIEYALLELRTATAGLIGPALAVNLVALGVLALVIFGVGRGRPADVGWRLAAILPALLSTAALWIALQLILVVLAALGWGALAWHEHWQRPLHVVGSFLGQLLGTALLEETVFRGFLLPQIYLKARRHYQWASALCIALLASQLAFGLVHLPTHVAVRNIEGWGLAHGQLSLLVFGLIHAGLYMATRNLFLCVGLHVISNEPASLAAVSGEPVQFALFGLVAAIGFAWLFVWWLRR
jgi:membrane protease YdiL (CAAX protease family)